MRECRMKVPEERMLTKIFGLTGMQQQESGEDL
jgi:hypothetical protein